MIAFMMTFAIGLIVLGIAVAIVFPDEDPMALPLARWLILFGGSMMLVVAAAHMWRMWT